MSNSINKYSCSHPFLYYTTVGGVAGCVESIIGMPTTNIGNALITKNAIPKTTTALYRGWKVQLPAMVSFFGTVILFNEMIKQNVQSHTGESHKAWKWASPILSGVLGTLILNPMDALIIQMGKHQCPNSWKIVNKIYQEAGIKGFTRGFSASMYRNAIYSTGVLFASEKLMESISTQEEMRSSESIHQAKRCLTSGIAGGLASIFSQPFHVLSVRSKMDLTVHFEMFSSIKKILKTEGMNAFYKGSLPRFTRMTMGSMLVAPILNFLTAKK